MFQITRRADYTVRLMLDLAEHEAEDWVPARDIARRMLVPRAFLYKITADVVAAGFVRTAPGPSGGLALARPAGEINLLQIVEAADGPVCLNSCLLRPRECPRDRICPAHTFWGRLQADVMAQMSAVTLDVLAEEARALRAHPASLPLVLPDPVRVVSPAVRLP